MLKHFKIMCSVVQDIFDENIRKEKWLEKVYTDLKKSGFDIDIYSSSLVRVKKFYGELSDHTHIFDIFLPEATKLLKKYFSSFKIKIINLNFVHYGFILDKCCVYLESNIYTFEVHGHLIRQDPDSTTSSQATLCDTTTPSSISQDSSSYEPSPPKKPRYT